jgi:N-acetylmuramoyl-L-alanine amidase
MAQFDAKTLRLVFEHNEPIAIRSTPKGSIPFTSISRWNPQNTSSSTPTPKPEVKEPPPLLAALPPLMTSRRVIGAKKLL